MFYLTNKIWITSSVLIPLNFLNPIYGAILEVSVEKANDAPAAFEDTKIKVFIKNIGDEPLTLPDRFSGKNQVECFAVQIVDQDNKPVTSSHYIRYSFPREEKNITLNPEKRVVVPITFGKVFYDPRLPARYVLKKIEADRDYKLMVTYVWFSEKEGVIKQRVTSEPIDISFEERDIPDYMKNNVVLLSDPKDLSAEKATEKDDADKLGIEIVPANNAISLEDDAITVTFENKWDVPVMLWKLQPDNNGTSRNCTLSFLLCKKDGTMISSAFTPIGGNYDPTHNSKIKSNGTLSIPVKLSNFLPESAFDKPGEYYLIARYHNTVGDKCLQGTWYGQPCKINIAGKSAAQAKVLK